MVSVMLKVTFSLFFLGSELQCRTEVRAKKPRDVTFPKGYFEDVKIPLSKFTTKEDMKKAKSDKVWHKLMISFDYIQLLWFCK